MRPSQQLKSMMRRHEATTVPGASDALSARIIEDLGFRAIYVTGAGIANARLGAPDIGLTTLTEIADTVARIADATTLPLIVDADTGFGNPLNMIRTVRVLERAGAAAIQIEDQVFPKKCGHFSGKAVVPLPEMVQKVRAAADARSDQDLQIIARTDAIAVEGFEAAIERAAAFVEAGADATFIEAPGTLKQLAQLPRRVSVPQVANIVFGGRTPDPGRDALAEMGFSIVLYANAALQASIRASCEVLRTLRDEGSLASVGDRLAPFEERQRIVAKDAWDAWEARYRD